MREVEAASSSRWRVLSEELIFDTGEVKVDSSREILIEF